MTVLGQIVHPRMTTAIAGVGVQFYPSLCTVQAATKTANSMGEETETWADVVGLVSLPCNIAPNGQNEARGIVRTVEIGTHRVCLQAHYAVTAMQHAIVDGVTYNILAVEQDSQSAFTALRVELVK